MKNLCCLLIIFLIFSCGLMAQGNTSGTLKPLSQNNGEYLQGDIFEVEVAIWPVSQDLSLNFKALQTNTIFDCLYVNDVKSAGASENNADVFVATIEVVGVRPCFLDDKLKIDLPHFGIVEIKSDELRVKELKDKAKGFFIADQDSDLVNKWFKIIVILLVVVGLSVVVFVKRDKLLAGLNFKKRQKLKLLKNKFANDLDRLMLEQIYKEVSTWENFIEDKSLIQLFSNKMEEHQYKRRWSEQEMQDVGSVFAKIKKVIDEL